MKSAKHAVVVLIGLLFVAGVEGRQGSPALPTPSGNVTIGRRLVALSRATGGEKRTMAVALWYPACKHSSSASAPCFPSCAFDRSVLKDFLGDEGISVSTHAHEAAGPCPGSAALLLFSPGLGVPIYSYSAQFEELASRGYVVAAVQHPFEGV